MTENLKKLGKALFIGFGTLGLVMAFGYVVLIFFKVLFSGGAASDEIAQGKHLLWLTWAMSFGFIIWQYYSVKKDFSESSNAVLSIILVIALIFGGFGVVARMLAFYDINFLANGLSYLVNFFTASYFDDSYDAIKGGTGSPGAEEYIITQILQSIFTGATVFGIVFGTLYLFFRVGILTSGLAFATAFHNWVNGMSFDLSVLYGFILETTLSEFWGTVLAISQFLINIAISRWLGNSTVSDL